MAENTKSLALPRFMKTFTIDSEKRAKQFKLKSLDPSSKPLKLAKNQDSQVHLDALAMELDQFQDLLHANGKRRVLVVLQGTDASGKDGTVRWVFSRTSPLGVKVASFKAPTEDELARDFLWRCHAVVPKAGEMMIWNRSHYEDVLVPPVNGWIDAAQVKQRYQQIRDFEQMLVQTGTEVIKFMLHISKDEQRDRLQERVDDPAKHWKFSLGDLEVRKQWDVYQKAYQDLIRATATVDAPWYVIPADSKTQRNLLISTVLIQRLKAMKLEPPAINEKLVGLVID